MDKVKTVSGTGTVSIGGESIGHCVYEINVYKDDTGRIMGRGQVMAEAPIVRKISAGPTVSIVKNEDKTAFAVVPGEWSFGKTSIAVETGADIAR